MMATRIDGITRTWGVCVGVAAVALLGFFTIESTTGYLLAIGAPLLIVLFLDGRQRREEGSGRRTPTDLSANWALIVVVGLFMGLLAGVWVDH